MPKRLYTVKQHHWFVFPTKEDAALMSWDMPAVISGGHSPSAADFWTLELGCLVTWIEPESNFMVVEVDGKFVKIVGDRVGWIVADMNVDWVKTSFEEITHV